MEGRQIPQGLWGQDHGESGNLSPSSVPLALKTQTLKHCHTGQRAPWAVLPVRYLSLCRTEALNSKTGNSFLNIQDKRNQGTPVARCVNQVLLAHECSFRASPHSEGPGAGF